MKIVIAILAFLAVANAIELTPDNWDEQTAGKSVFIKFYAPWCGHCKAMKPAWDQLMDEFSGSETALVADVDCTGDGEPLCNANGVRGFPTVKFGDPNDLEEYQGGRSYDALLEFAQSNLGPSCGPANMDLCDEEKAAAINAVLAMEEDAIEAEIAEIDAAYQAAAEEFEAEVEKLTARYEELVATREEAEAAIDADRHKTLRSVLSFKKNSDDAAAEEGHDEL